MKLKICSLSTLSKNEIIKYGIQISQWYYDSWGNISGGTQPDFLQEIIARLKTNSAKYFVAIDTDTGECVGVINYKQKNMQDDPTFKDKKWGPWFSGLYVRPDYRGKKISAILLKHVASEAIKRNDENLYLYTHFNLEKFYQKLEGEELRDSMGEKYIYKNKPIYLSKNNARKCYEILNQYLLSNGIVADQQNSEYSLPSNRRMTAKM